MQAASQGHSIKLALRLWLVAVASLCGAAWAVAQPRPAVIELYTSQGCSSCPPVEAYLGQLSARRPDVLTLAFHVDYWDGLGWRDRFALAQSAERQRTYASNLRRSSVYTPQLVIDGQSAAPGAERQALESAVRGRRDGLPVTLSVRDDALLVDVGARPGGPGSDVLLVSYLRHAVSPVGRGENAGRTLEEFNIVRAIRTLGTWRGESESFHIPLASLPSDATDVAVLVQPFGQAPIIGAVAQALPIGPHTER